MGSSHLSVSAFLHLLSRLSAAEAGFHRNRFNGCADHSFLLQITGHNWSSSLLLSFRIFPVKSIQSILGQTNLCFHLSTPNICFWTLFLSERKDCCTWLHLSFLTKGQRRQANSWQPWKVTEITPFPPSPFWNACLLTRNGNWKKRNTETHTFLILTHI